MRLSRSFHRRQLADTELSQRPNQLDVRNGDDILRVEHAGAQERDGHGRLESGLAWTRRMWNEPCAYGSACQQQAPRHNKRMHQAVRQNGRAPLVMRDR